LPVRATALLLFTLPLVLRVPEARAKTPTIPAWCAPEIETLPGNVCHFDGNGEARRTLVVFLHGLVPRYAPWQWTQERAIVRMAKTLHFAAIFPQAPTVGPGGSGGYAWPGVVTDRNEQIAEGWTAAKNFLETRSGHTYDEVFVVGFSSGAYYAASLAMRGRFLADGYVVLAGGAPREAAAEGRRSPIYVGVSGRDRHTAPNARELGRSLTLLKWPHKTDEQRVGHMVANVHMTHALAYLRGEVDTREAAASGE
jgi:predicted esterase